MSTEAHLHDHKANKVSLILSAICIVHCLFTPVLVVVLPFAGTFMHENHWIELLIILGIVLLGSSSLKHGYRYHHHNKKPIILFVIGLVLLLISSMIHFIADSLFLHHVFGVIGGLLVGGAQLYNLKLSR
ncbi:MAG: MerC domain-containing protein [Chitinophagales bacterium]|nr:MerC domain-containing protein [Chitinophagales bacterium]